jgi:hypothetical protein
MGERWVHGDGTVLMACAAGLRDRGWVVVSLKVRWGVGDGRRPGQRGGAAEINTGR